MADGYRVIGQRETTQITPDGRFMDGVQITIQTDAIPPAVLSAFVPHERYEPNYVRSVLQELADKANEIAKS